jgi:hypothetical protein
MKFVSKQLAMILKEKGFDKPCFGWYYIKTPTGMTDGELVLNRYPYRNVTYEDTLKKHIGFINPNKVDAPTTEQVLEWLREEKKIHISIDVLSSMNKNFMCKQEPRLIFDVRVAYFKEEIFNYHELAEPYFKYDDACIAGIEYIINNNLI